MAKWRDWIGGRLGLKSLPNNGNSFVINTATSGGFGYSDPLFLNFREQAARENTIVRSCINWSKNNAAGPPLRLQKFEADEWNDKPDKYITPLLSDPWPGETATRWKEAMVHSLGFAGNAYSLILRENDNPNGRVIGLQWVIHTAVSAVPVSGKPNVIDYYQIEGMSRKILPSEMFHVKDGFDPTNLLLGEARIKSGMRHILTDNQLAAYCHAVLLSPNPGLLISPQNPEDTISDTSRQTLESMLRRSGGGEKYGGIAISPAAVKAEKLGFSPADFNLDALTNNPEERICALMGISPIVVGLGAGLDASTYSNFQEARAAATENHLVPIWRTIEDALTQQILPLFGLDSTWRIAFDLSDVPGLQEDRTAAAKRAALLFEKNILDRAEALAEMHMDFKPEDAGIYSFMFAPKAMSAPADPNLDNAAKTRRIAAENNVQG